MRHRRHRLNTSRSVRAEALLSLVTTGSFLALLVAISHLRLALLALSSVVVLAGLLKVSTTVQTRLPHGLTLPIPGTQYCLRIAPR